MVRMFAFVCAVVSGAASGGVSQFVDPKIGGSYNGHTYPGATCPFGLVQASPDTAPPYDWQHCSGYVWEDPFIYGFSQTHLSGTGCSDLSDVRLLPFSDDFADANPENWRLAKDFRTEVATPGYYSVAFPSEGVKVEATATHRTAAYRLSYGKGRRARLLVDFQWMNGWEYSNNVVRCSSTLAEDRRSISGWRDTKAWLKRHVAWKVIFDRPWKSVEKLYSVYPQEKGERYVLDFGELDSPLDVRVSISTVDEEGAAKNFEAESAGRSFDEIRAACRAGWNAILSRFEIPGASADQATAFYTSLYHLFTQPNDIADVDGRYRGGDGRVAAAKGGRYYTGLSLWDTFRAAHPFYTFAAPEIVDDIVNSMLAHYKATGFLPVIPYFGWESYCMIGNHSVPVIVDAYLKREEGNGKREEGKVDWELAFEAVTNSLTVAHFEDDGRPKRKEDWAIYDSYGYYPIDLVKTECVSRTLECGYDDWCAAEFCKALGRGDEAFFRRRAEGWRKVFDPSIGFMRGKDSKGVWREPFNPFALGHDSQDSCDFTEGNSFQYTWHVLQDPQGLIAAFGGARKFVERLDALFVQPESAEGMGRVIDVTGLIGQYAHGNEPSHHVAYLYTLAGRPDRAAEVVRDVMERFYLTTPGGLCGNDDCGQMSAWYVFAAMGFYPVNPCGGEYVIGAPQFPEVSVSLSGGRKFRTVAKNLSRANKYVKSVSLDGRPLSGWTIRHADIVRGGELVFEMTDKPQESNAK